MSLWFNKLNTRLAEGEKAMWHFKHTLLNMNKFCFEEMLKYVEVIAELKNLVLCNIHQGKCSVV